MSAEELLDQIEDRIKEKFPDVPLTNLEFEGPKLVVYTTEPGKLISDRKVISDLAKDMQKRVIVRADPSILTDPDHALDLIKQIVPEESGITNCSFDDNTGELFIEAEKPGLVIGKRGSTLKEINKIVGWRPEVIRTPPIKSAIVDEIRRYLLSERESRRDFLRKTGERIHRRTSNKNKWSRITALGGCREVGRNAFILSTPETRILIDCGISVGSENDMIPHLYIPEASPIDQIDAVVLTHAHLDHSGLTPLLFKYGYDGPVYMTGPTRDLAALLQLDYVEVASREARKVPYDSSMIREEIKRTITLDYGNVTDIAPDVKLTMYNAGHILGSAMLHFHTGTGLHNVVFTGDFKHAKTLLFDSAWKNFPRAETLVMESTYGGSNDFQPSRQEAEANLISTINKTLERSGSVIIPAFAVGRSQEVMLVLEKAMRKGELEDVPVYLDGMIWDATAIHTTYPEYLNHSLMKSIFHHGMNPFLSDSFVKVDSEKKREEAMAERSSIILTTSGMLNGGPVLEYLQNLAPNEENTLVFVGYQAEGTLGRRMQRGWRETRLLSGEPISINMEVKTIDGFSGHSDRKQLVDFVRHMKPRPESIIAVHGDENKCVDLASSIYKSYGISTRSPVNLESIRLV